MTGTLMAREMAEQPGVLARLVARFDADVARVQAVIPAPLAGIVFLARGSSDHAAVYGRYLAEIAAGRPAGLAAPSLHTLYHARVDYSGYLVVALSQSGATPEIVTVCERMRAAGGRVIAITNEGGSPLTEAADDVLRLDAGTERAVPATKTMTAELLAVAAVASALGPVPFTRDELAALPGAVAAVLADDGPARRLAAHWATVDRMFVATRGLLYGVALEAALKIKETTGVLAEGYSAADLRHGPVAAVEAGAPVLILDAGGAASADLRDLGTLARGRGAPVAVCAPRPEADLPVPGEVPEALSAITITVQAQHVALALARARGVDPDAPQGLSKVTRTQ